MLLFFRSFVLQTSSDSSFLKEFSETVVSIYCFGCAFCGSSFCCYYILLIAIILITVEMKIWRMKVIYKVIL